MIGDGQQDITGVNTITDASSGEICFLTSAKHAKTLGQSAATGVLVDKPVDDCDMAQLVVANHISWLDIQLLHSISPMSFVAKAEIKKWPIAGLMASVGESVFHHRGSHDSASGVSTVMAERLRQGAKVAIFPEGGILPGAGVKRFHARLFAAAIETGVPVQPVMIRYLRDGHHYDGMTFLAGEHFVANFFRLLGQKRCVAEMCVLPLIDSAGQQRRDLAQASELAVRAAYDSEPAEPGNG